MIGVIDNAQLIDFDLIEKKWTLELSNDRVKIVQYRQIDEGLRDLKSSKLESLYLIGEDYLQKGAIEVYTMESRLVDTPGLAELHRLLRESLLRKLLPASSLEQSGVSATIDRMLTSIEPKRFTLNDNGSRAPAGSVINELVPYGIVALLFISIFNSASYLLQSTAEEKENRVIEVMLSSVKPEQLLWGKILGLGGAALFQVIVYLILFGFSAIYLVAFINITPLKLGLFLIYSLLGYLLYSGLLTATGVIGENKRESVQLAGNWSLTAISPLLFSSIIIRSPDGYLSRLLSFIPFTSPVTMILRLSTSVVPLVDIVISLLLLTAGIFFIVRGAAKIFRTGSLMYGKRITGKEIWRWLRQA
jgi:ABC-2 type transport system permease protein